jgi:CheY-like chemotaxis protein
MKKILIVEDELIVRSIYRRKFEISGYQVETAEEGAAALNLMPSFKPDAVQVDIMMPGMDGVEVIRQIRAWPEFKSIPILVISSFYRPDLAKEAWKAGATKCVSKMDCTPNLALELVEQMLSGEGGGTSLFAKLGTVAITNDSIRVKPAESPWHEATEIITRKSKLASCPSLPTLPAPIAAPARKPPTTLPAFGQKPSVPAGPAVVRPDPGNASRITLPSFARPSVQKLPKPAASDVSSTSPDHGAGERESATSVSTAPSPLSTGATANALPDSSAGAANNANFRIEIRQEFLKRAPQIQTDLRDRVAALLRSKSTTDQIALLHQLEASVSSLAGLSGITGFSRISHLSGAIDALIKDLHKKPAQMTNSVLRTIAHASDCLNMLFRDLERTPRDIPQSMLILAVDDEPIARRTISVALGKANLRCISMEDSRAALAILHENPFDLIFLDAEMPGLNGFALCSELRKLPTNKTTPVIFVTSLTKFEARAQSSLAGANDLIAKPFLMMELAVKALTYLLKPQPIVDAKTRSK